MSRRRYRRGKPKPKEVSRVAIPRGFDYGTLPTAAAMGSTTFAKNLHDADIVAAAYSFSRSEVIGQTLPEILLVGQNQAALIKAFEEFQVWAMATDGDSLELTIVFTNDGGYVLGLMPEPKRLELRCLGFDRTHRIIDFAIAWIKPIPTVHRMLRQLRRYCASFPSPFHVSAAYLPKSAGDPVPSDVQPIPNIPVILKFEATFIDEDDVTSGSVPEMLLSIVNRRGRPQGKPKKRRNFSSEDLNDFRRRMLRTHFPVTLERIHNCEPLVALRKAMIESGVTSWQFDQAICNAVLSRELTGEPHYQGLSSRQTKERIVQAIRERFERADMTPLPTLTVEEIREQITFDGASLLAYVGRKRLPKNLEAMQKHLSDANLLTDQRPPSGPIEDVD